jgi:DnaJ-class molecular chaperone
MFFPFEQVKTVDGLTELKIPPGTQPGDVLVLAKQGVPQLNKPSIRGDHLFTVNVTIPKRIRYTDIINYKLVNCGNQLQYISLYFPFFCLFNRC